MSNEEFSCEVDEKSIDNLKKIIDTELEERSKRFNNGVETIDDLINGYRHYKICNDKGLDLDVVELKYYKRLIDLYKQARADLYEANNRINDLLEIIKQKDKMIDLMANDLKTPVNSKEWIKEYYKKRCEDAKD